MVMAGVSLVLQIFGMASDSTKRNIDGVDDDDLREEMIDAYDRTTDIILGVISIVMSLVSIVGAVTYNKWMVGLSIIWSVIGYILYIVYSQEGLNIILDTADESDTFFNDFDDLETIIRVSAYVGYGVLGVITALWIYPSVFFINEIRSGVMSAETYKREEYSCCCT